MSARFSKVASEKTARPAPSEVELRALIEQAAYFRAEKRGFAPGEEVDDWVAAEAEVMARLREGRAPI